MSREVQAAPADAIERAAQVAESPHGRVPHLGFRDGCVYAAIRVLLFPLEAAPLRMSLWCARRAATVAFLFARGRRRVVEHNLVRVYGERLDVKARRRFAHRVFQNFAMTAIEMLQVPRLIRRGRLDRLIERRGHFEDARKILDSGRSVLLVGLHAGAWEFGLPCLALERIQALAVMRPPDRPWATALFRHLRADHGALMLDKKGALHALAQGVARGSPIALMLDQNDRHGVFVDFLGHAAQTNPIAGLLSQRYRIAIAVGSVQRLVPGRRYRFYLGPPTLHAPPGTAAERIHAVTSSVTNELERHIRSMPEQWLWLHQRWKNRPDGSRERIR